jgi:hypothetical protein
MAEKRDEERRLEIRRAQEEIRRLFERYRTTGREPSRFQAQAGGRARDETQRTPVPR